MKIFLLNLKKYCMSNDDKDLKTFREAEDKYVREHINQ